VPEHLFWVVPGRVAGRPGPRGPWGVPWDPSKLARAGVDSVLSLDGEQCEVDEMSRAGLRHLLVHIAGESPPVASTESSCRDALPVTCRFLCEEYESSRCVVVHCGGGRDRTGLVLAHFLKHLTGVTPTEAVSRVRKARSDALTSPGWYELALRLLAS
jgi:protein-tyrosine phosphatase